MVGVLRAPRVVAPSPRVSSSLTPPAPIIPSGTPRFGAPKREEKEIWRCAFSSSPLARDPPSPTSARLLLLRASLLNQSRGATSSRLARATPPRLPGPKIAPHALFPLLLGAQSWADEPEGEFPRIPHGFNAFGGAPHSMGGLGFQQQQHSVPGGPGLFQAQAPPGGFAEREPPNDSFGVGSPGAVAPGFAVGSPGARGPRPASVPWVPRAPVSVARPSGSAPQPGSSPGGNGYREARPARPQVPIPTAPPFTAFVGNFHTSALRMRLPVYSPPTRARAPTFAWFATAITIVPEDTSPSSRMSRVSSARSSSIRPISAVVRSA